MGPLTSDRDPESGYLALDVLVLLAVVLLGFSLVFESLGGALSAAARQISRIEKAIQVRNELPETPPNIEE